MPSSRLRRLALTTLALTLLGCGTAWAAVPGDPDSSFSGDGLLSTSFNSTTTFNVNDLAIDGDGKLLIVGADGNGDARVARLHPDGTFDNSFGGDGDVAINAGTPNDIPFSVAVDPAGNILVLGTVQATDMDLFMARLLPGGGLDPSFDGPALNGDGLFGLNFGDFEGAGDVMADGTQVVFTANVTQTLVARIARLESNGEFDTDFNTTGFRDFQWSSGVHSFATGLARQGDGKYIVAGAVNGVGPYGVARFTTAGQLDGTFNSAGTIPGIARPPVPSGYFDAGANDVVVDSSGITVAGAVEADDTFDVQPMLARVDSAGLPDATFGTEGGYSVLPLTATNSETFLGLSARSGGGYLAGGQSGALGPPEARRQLFARFTGTGAPDPAFSGDGYTELNPDGTSSRAGGLAASPAGVAYIAGSGSSFNLAVSAVCGEVPPACPSTETTPPPGGGAGAGETGRRAAALKKCKKVKNRVKRKKCKKRAAKLPV